jgi:type VI secretion system protein ImpH
MAAHGWRAGTSVADWLFAEGHRFDFYQAVRLLEMLHPERAPVGEGRAAKEAVRFCSAISLSFPATDVAAVENPERPVMTVNFMGLAGALGPLPLPFTERILDRLREKDTALRDFLDLFNHRLISLVYRVRRVHRVGIEWGSPETHRFATSLFSILGLETAGLRGRLGVPDRALLRYAGLLCRHPRSTSVLRTILSDFFGVPVADEQFLGAFRTFDEDQWTLLGEGGQNQALGQTARLGTELWDQHAGVALRLGPLTWAAYQDLLPGQPGFMALGQLTRFYLGPLFDFTVRLQVRGEEVEPGGLHAEEGPRLGWTSWLTLGRPLRGPIEVEVACVPQGRGPEAVLADFLKPTRDPSDRTNPESEPGPESDVS